MRFLLFFAFLMIIVSCDNQEIINPTNNTSNATNSAPSQLSEDELKRVIVAYAIDENGDTVLQNVTSENREYQLEYVENGQIQRDSLYYIRNRRDPHVNIPFNISFAIFDNTTPVVTNTPTTGSEPAFRYEMEAYCQILVDGDLWVTMPDQSNNLSNQIHTVEDKGVHFIEMLHTEEVFNVPTTSEYFSDSLRVFWISGEIETEFYQFGNQNVTKRFRVKYDQYPIVVPKN